MAKRWLAVDALVLGALVSLASVPTAAASGTSSKRTGPDLRSNAFYILDEPDSKVLAARTERVAGPIAFITKLMTALVVLEARQPMDQAITITRDDLRGTPGSSSRLAVGARICHLLSRKIRCQTRLVVGHNLVTRNLLGKSRAAESAGKNAE